MSPSFLVTILVGCVCLATCSAEATCATQCTCTCEKTIDCGEMCPMGYTMYSGKCYNVMKSPGTVVLSKATTECEATGGHVVDITSAEERHVITSLADAIPSINIWTSGVKESGKWYWSNSGDAVNFSAAPWSTGKPSNEAHNTVIDWRKRSGNWGLGDCPVTHFRHVICEACPTGYTMHAGKCYKVLKSLGMVILSKATEECEKTGGHVVDITSAAERHTITILADAIPSINIWTSGVKKSGKWYWSNSDDAVNFFDAPWSAGKPSNEAHNTVIDWRKRSGKWGLGDCPVTHFRHVICEI